MAKADFAAIPPEWEPKIFAFRFWRESLMKMRTFLIGFLSILVVAGCGKKEEATGPENPATSKARYAGVGLYQPGRLWSLQAERDAKAADGAPATDKALANLSDDDEIIVVVDSRTGEIRQCGNHSGHCIAMNPWEGPDRPVRLSKHMADLAAEDANEARNEAN